MTEQYVRSLAAKAGLRLVCVSPEHEDDAPMYRLADARTDRFLQPDSPMTLAEIAAECRMQLR